MDKSQWRETCANVCFLNFLVTLLAILANHAIAVPLSPSFPANELRYIIDQSQAVMLLSTEKYQSKSDEVTKEGLSHKVITAQWTKIKEGGKNADQVSIEEDGGSQGGMMLYTSGTTSRPVSSN
jgi:malonyl-CoA/methylmalonyl-CoA synthetase